MSPVGLVRVRGSTSGSSRVGASSVGICGDRALPLPLPLGWAGEEDLRPLSSLKEGNLAWQTGDCFY